ncbi:cytochrome P450 2U1-like [Styela clava]
MTSTLLNEALVKQGDKCSGRPENYVFDLITTGRGLTTRDYGSIWKDLHKFGLMTLRGFGVGKKGMEANVIEETPFLIENLTSKNGQRLHKQMLIQYIRDLFDAGSETTSTTLGWALLCFENYPECQERIADEVKKTLDGLPSMKHQKDMPYTCAFIHELMKHRTLVPLSVYHKTNEEATLDGYIIPKSTTVAPNLWAVHFDPKHFANPEEFRPERFLDREGKFIKSNYVIPFSIGPRSWIGKQLAKMEIFIFLTGIVQKLKVLPNSKKPLPSFHDGGFSLISYQPQNFEVIFEKR